MGLFDFIIGKKIPTEAEIDSLIFNSPNVKKTPEYYENMGIDAPKAKESFGTRFTNALFGVPTGAADNIGDVETNTDGQTTISMGIGNQPRTGGFFRDMASGYRENRFNPISIDNLAPNQDKNWANRIGEGLGTLARIGESPLGRGLLVGGIVGASGGNGLEALAYGAGTGMKNQAYRMQDKLYKQSLIDDYGYSPEAVNSLRGYIDGESYKNMAAARQMRDNAEYRNALLQSNLQNQKMRMLEADRDYAYKQRALNLKERELENDIQNSNQENAQDLAEVKQQLDNFSSMFDRMPGKAESYTLGKLRGWTGTQTQDEANFNSQRTLLFNQIARKLGGEKGVLSDQDIKRIEAALPNLTDSKEQKNAKMKAVYDLLDIRSGKGIKQDSLGIL